jgi:hypothetical protein
VSLTSEALKPRDNWYERVKVLFPRAHSSDQGAIAEVRKLFDEHQEMWEGVGDLADQAG